MTDPKQNLLKNKNFRMLFIGETVSHLGDQFSLIALPWLVLKLTSDPLALGAVLALAGIPRAVFMLLGGALADRFSPRKVMLASNIVRLVNVGVLAALILSGNISLWMVYVYALVFGTADAFFVPSQTSLVTRLAPKEKLEQANTFIMGSAQLAQFVGPALVGVIIGLFDRGSDSLTGIGLAMAFDALTFVVSLAALLAIRVPTTTSDAPTENLLGSIKSGLSYAWSNGGLRHILFLVAAINFLMVGPIIVGIPVIAESTLAEGAAGYGIIMSAFGIGTVIGFVLVGIMSKITSGFNRMSVLLLLTAAVGPLLALMAAAETTLSFALISFAIAVVTGYVSIAFISLIQRQVPGQMMGRIMSIISLAAIGLLPVSQIVSGLVVRLGASPMFLVAGVLFSAVTLVTYLAPEVRAFGGITTLAEQPAPCPVRVENGR